MNSKQYIEHRRTKLRTLKQFESEKKDLNVKIRTLKKELNSYDRIFILK